MHTHERELFNAAMRWFTQWRDAVAAADVDYSKVAHHIPGKWNTKTVVTAIKDRSRNGLSLCVTAARQGDKALACLITAAQHNFGSWRAAVRAAGLNDQELLRTNNRHWTAGKIIRGIQKRFRQGKSLGFRVWSADDQPLYGAVMRIFGSRELGIRAAGLDPQLTGGKGSWTTTRILTFIKLLHQNCESLSASYVLCHYNTLFRAAVQYFGSWGVAVEAAGFDYAAHRKYRCSAFKWLASIDADETDRVIQRTLDLIVEEKYHTKTRRRSNGNRNRA